jgi:hypothetical protein
MYLNYSQCGKTEMENETSYEQHHFKLWCNLFLIVHRLGELLVTYLWVCWFREKQPPVKERQVTKFKLFVQVHFKTTFIDVVNALTLNL